MQPMKKITIRVNTPKGEHDWESEVCAHWKDVGDVLGCAQDAYPEWTSMVVTVTQNEISQELLRTARNLVKEAIRKAGMKVSLYDAKEITRAARAYQVADTTLFENLAYSLRHLPPL